MNQFIYSFLEKRHLGRQYINEISAENVCTYSSEFTIYERAWKALEADGLVAKIVAQTDFFSSIIDNIWKKRQDNLLKIISIIGTVITLSQILPKALTYYPHIFEWIK
jgi:hypothetical protein